MKTGSEDTGELARQEDFVPDSVHVMPSHERFRVILWQRCGDYHIEATSLELTRRSAIPPPPAYCSGSSDPFRREGCSDVLERPSLCLDFQQEFDECTHELYIWAAAGSKDTEVSV